MQDTCQTIEFARCRARETTTIAGITKESGEEEEPLSSEAVELYQLEDIVPSV